MTKLKPKPERNPSPSAAQIICDPLLLPSQFLCASRQLDQKAESPSVAAEISKQADQFRSGDLSAVETRLLGQILMLENFWADCLIKSQVLVTSGEFLRHESATQMLTQLALRAQDQARRTIATLNELRSPKRTTFIKTQNNIENQLNQVLIENAELKRQLGAATNAKMDTGSAEAPEPNYETVEAVGVQHGATYSGGKS